MSKALVVFSGGQDSTTCLFWALKQFSEVYAVTYDYGQRHAIEISAACKIATMAGPRLIEHQVINVGPILQGTSPLTNKAAVLEQYKDRNSLPGGLEKTFVPLRNMLFLTLAANHAYVRGITDVVTGVCQEDFGGYPDCRQVFIWAHEQAVRYGVCVDEKDKFNAFKIHTPLMNMTKAQSVEMAHEDPDCWEALAYSHTAYDGAYPPVGKDHATLLREKGFVEANLPDPLILRAVREGLMPMPTTGNYRREAFKE